MLAHPIPPVFNKDSKVLVLGSFPSVKSREEGFFYGHPQNRFWKVTARVFDEDIPVEAEKTLDLEKKEYTYRVMSTEEDGINEIHRVFFKGNQSVNVTVSYTKRWESKIGGEVCDHIMNSAKFN